MTSSLPLPSGSSREEAMRLFALVLLLLIVFSLARVESLVGLRRPRIEPLSEPDRAELVHLLAGMLRGATS